MGERAKSTLCTGWGDLCMEIAKKIEETNFDKRAKLIKETIH